MRDGRAVQAQRRVITRSTSATSTPCSIGRRGATSAPSSMSVLTLEVSALSPQLSEHTSIRWKRSDSIMSTTEKVPGATNPAVHQAPQHNDTARVIG